MTLHSGQITDQEYVPLTVELKVSSFNKSLDFYTKILGFEAYRIDNDNKHATLLFNKGLLMIKEDPSLEKRENRKEFFVKFTFPNDEELEKYEKWIQSRGALILHPLKEMSYGQKRFYTTDLDGYQIKFVS